tara:strand:- start:3190 stop:4137 length:948 start_codon:yes stop_codon:yes gene_type:complete
MSKNQVTSFAPASIGNVGPGFDVFGLALKGLGDYVAMKRTSEPGVRILKIEGDSGRLPLVSSKNTAGLAAENVLKICEQKGDSFGVELTLKKGLPINSGLGSSGASAAAAARAVSKLTDVELLDEELLAACVEAEAGVAGYHADNVAPSLLGGFVIVESYEPLTTLRLIPPVDIPIGIIKPDIEVATKEARDLVPELITINSMIHNLARSTSMVAHLMRGDVTSFGKAIRDIIVEPARATLVPGFFQAKKNLLGAGALGCSLSGSGPSLFYVATDQDALHSLAKVAINAFEEQNIKANFIATGIDTEGSIEVLDE